MKGIWGSPPPRHGPRARSLSRTCQDGRRAAVQAGVTRRDDRRGRAAAVDSAMRRDHCSEACQGVRVLPRRLYFRRLCRPTLLLPFVPSRLHAAPAPSYLTLAALLYPRIRRQAYPWLPNGLPTPDSTTTSRVRSAGNWRTQTGRQSRAGAISNAQIPPMSYVCVRSLHRSLTLPSNKACSPVRSLFRPARRSSTAISSRPKCQSSRRTRRPTGNA